MDDLFIHTTCTHPRRLTDLPTDTHEHHKKNKTDETVLIFIWAVYQTNLSYLDFLMGLQKERTSL